MDWFSLIQATASIATACGVAVAAVQLTTARRQARTQFEDSMTQQYVEIVAKLPFQIMLGEDLSESQQEKELQTFYHYFNLCNEQIMYRRQNRISKATWKNWCDGMKSNFGRPAFAKAWDLIKRRSDNFHELRRLENEDFDSDPLKWRGEGSLPLSPSQPTPAVAVTNVSEDQEHKSVQQVGRR